MGKISNVMVMLSLLNNGRKSSVEELSNILEVTPRMVRFYKEELEKAGIYIDTIRGPYGGYVLNQSIRLPSRKFSKSDVEFLKSLKENNEIEEEKLDIIIDKVAGVYWANKEDSETLNLVDDNRLKYNLFSKAIKEKRKVEILYYSYNKGNNRRVIRPYDLFLYENNWGVVAFCEVKKDLRHFEFSRIREFNLLDDKF